MTSMNIVSHASICVTICLSATVCAEQLVRADELTNVAADQYGDQLPSGAVARLGTVRYRQAGNSHRRQIFFLPGSSHLIQNSGSGPPVVWDAETGHRVREYTHSDDRVGTIAVHRPTNELAMVTWNMDHVAKKSKTRLTIRRGKTGRQFSWSEPFGDITEQMDFSPVAGAAATVGRHDVVRFRDLASGDVIRREDFGRADVASMDWSGDGKYVAVAAGKHVYMFDWNSDDLPVRSDEFSSKVQFVRFSNDGLHLAVVGWRNTPVSRLHVPTLRNVREFVSGEEPFLAGEVCFSADDKTLIVPNCDHKTIHFFGAETGELNRTLDAKGSPIKHVSTDDEGKLLAAVGRRASIMVWDLQSGERISDKFEGHNEPATSLQFTSDGKRVVSAGSDGTVRIWDASTGRQLRTLHHGGRWMGGLGLSGDNSLIVSMGLDNAIRLWDSTTGRQIHSTLGHGQSGGSSATAIAFCKGNQEYLTFGGDEIVRRWETKSGKLLQRLPIATGEMENRDGFAGMGPAMVKDPSFDSNQKNLIFAEANVVCSCDLESGLQTALVTCGEEIERAAKSPNDSMLATLHRIPNSDSDPLNPSFHGRLQIYDLKLQKVLHVIPLPEPAYATSFSHDGRLLAVSTHPIRKGRNERSVQVYDVRLGTRVALIPVGSSSVHGLAFSPGGHRIATCHNDTSILIWYLADFLRPHNPE